MKGLRNADLWTLLPVILALALLLPAVPAYAQGGDGRLNPEVLEYYTIYCHDDFVDVYRADGNLLNQIPLANLIALNSSGGTWAIGRDMSVTRVGDSITIYGPNGNNGGEPPSKSFTLGDCVVKNGRVPAPVSPSGGTSFALQAEQDDATAATTCTHTVSAGDTVESVAAFYGVTADSVRGANALTGSFLYPGQLINIPGCVSPFGMSSPGSILPSNTTTALTPISPDQLPSGYLTHVLLPGQNLFRLSLRYGVTVQTLMEINGITDVTRIPAYTVIVVPPPEAAPCQ